MVISKKVNAKKMNEKDTVLVVVDMQKGFIRKGSGVIIPNVLKLIKFFKQKNIPVVFTKNYNPKGSQYDKLVGWKRLRTSPETDFIDELQVGKNVVINKTIYSAFTPEFARLATKNKWENIVLCGIATDNCVLKTAVDAFEKNLRPIAITDAIYSHGGKRYHRAGLMILKRFIGKNQLLTFSQLHKFIN